MPICACTRSIIAQHKQGPLVQRPCCVEMCTYQSSDLNGSSIINNLLMVWNICPWCPLSFSIAATNTEDYEQSHRFRSCPCCGTCWAQLFCTEHMLCTQDACSMYPHMLEQIALYMLTRLLLTWHTLDFQMVLDSWITMTSKCSWIAKCFFSSNIKVPASHSKVATSADIVHSNFHSWQLYKQYGLIQKTEIIEYCWHQHM